MSFIGPASLGSKNGPFPLLFSPLRAALLVPNSLCFFPPASTQYLTLGHIFYTFSAFSILLPLVPHSFVPILYGFCQMYGLQRPPHYIEPHRPLPCRFRKDLYPSVHVLESESRPGLPSILFLLSYLLRFQPGLLFFFFLSPESFSYYSTQALKFPLLIETSSWKRNSRKTPLCPVLILAMICWALLPCHIGVAKSNV